MADDAPDKPGLLSRLFGRKPEPAPEEPKSAPVPAQAGETREDSHAPFANAADDLVSAPPFATSASPDVPPDEKLPSVLAGADLQPVEPAPAAEARLPSGPSPVPPADGEQKGWWQRLREGMRRTSSSLSESVTGLFTKRKLDEATLEELEDALVRADLGVATAMRITEAVSEGRYAKEISADEVKAILAAEVERALLPVAKPLALDRAKRPFVILMVGVNGSGKTTTIGKLAQKFRAQGMKVMIAAGDTFRAAAVEQLKVWGERVGAPVVARAPGSDAAGLAFDAFAEAREKGIDVLLIDTAGRLQNKAGLMAELEKIVRVLRKVDDSAPHATLLVLDATVGQNAVSQVELFKKAADVSGLVMTKLDGTARGGILVALAAQFGLPVHFIGVGEGIEDLEPFEAKDFARAIAGLAE